MSNLTTDPNDPRLKHGSDDQPTPQNEVYLVLSEEERAKGFIRPYRESYRHTGLKGPGHPLRDVTADEKERFGDDYVKFEIYPPSMAPKTGRFWTQAELDKIGKGCGAVTTMSKELAETYARQPHFYGSTYCVGCWMHRPVSEFVWVSDGTEVGS